MKKVAGSLDIRVVTKKEAAQRQIDVAINLLHEREYKSAITLARAAEGQMAKTADHPHLATIIMLSPHLGPRKPRVRGPVRS
jgi:hypothetical protein